MTALAEPQSGAHLPPLPVTRVAYPAPADTTGWRTPVDRDREREAADAETLARQNLEWSLFERAHALSVRHASAAWERRFRRPLVPYALAALFRQRTADGMVVTAATRLWLAGPEPSDPVDLLSALVALARGRDPRQPWDVRTALANRHDVPDDAVYTGLALSSLDTRTGTFAEACAAARSELHIPGTILYLAGDPAVQGGQRALVADRRGADGHNALTISSHEALSTPVILSRWPYTRVALPLLYERSGYGPVLRQMTELDGEIQAADEQRRGVPSWRRGR
ncbi:hypothetical protein Aph02nite_78190 [Actinoplanes philippinensis]|uniref:Uncharacterized protein n=1 Tax=Actinoplanes philippinensis TaxID=35752 RepID=A0A1I2KB85_9ACTN|nr:hypothetical protein [Actinoplanes philippinensis]GIE81869.1 hypothetical protein Aph02nite_78190 [Actinoplanes philippinensis]SFF64224.1 hypothetical protein SAMN05421541_11649 [Actinoplanes philippinensis]